MQERQGKDDFFQLSRVQRFHAPSVKCRQPRVCDACSYTSYVKLFCPEVMCSFPAGMGMCAVLLQLSWCGSWASTVLLPSIFCAVGSREIIRKWLGPDERSDYGSLFFIYFSYTFSYTFYHEAR